MIKLTEWLEEPGFELRRAWIADHDGRPEPRADLGGIECVIETKETLLEAGVASCWPVESRWAANWPLEVTVEVEGIAKRISGATADARVVAAARRFAELLAAGRAEIGKEL